MGVEIGLMAFGIALSIIGMILQKVNQPRNPVTRNMTSPTLAERGSFVPYVLGTARVGAVVGWVGQALTVKGGSGGGVAGILGGLFGGGSSGSTTVTLQSAWHILCVGPATGLNRIWQGGKIIFPTKNETPLNPIDNPSGSTISLAAGGAFRIYWGEHNQPVDPLLSSTPDASPPGIGIASKWPYICHIVWIRKHVSSTNQWPQLEYEVEVKPLQDDLLTNGPAWINGQDPKDLVLYVIYHPTKTLSLLKGYWNGTLSAFGPKSAATLYTFADATTTAAGLVTNPNQVKIQFYNGPVPNYGNWNSGVNPAHALMQLMTQKFPHGCGIDAGDIATDWMETAAQTGQDELQPVNLIVNNGDIVSVPVGNILSDFGMALPQVGNKLYAAPIRTTAVIAVFPNEAVLDPLPEIDLLFGPQPANRLAFVYKDRTLNYKDNDYTVDNDEDQNSFAPKPVSINLNTVSDLDIATKVIDRRQHEDLANVQTLKVYLAFAGRILSPGQVFSIPSTGNLRVVAVERTTDSAKCTVDCVPDVYSGDTTGMVAARSVKNDLSVDPLDEVIQLMELPPVFSTGLLELAVLRSRVVPQADKAVVNFSLDNANFYPLAICQTFMLQGSLDATGGTPGFIQPGIGFDTPAAVAETGPTFTCLNELDNDIFADLTGQDDLWRSGYQYAIIDQEICFFRKLVALGGGQYRIDGLIRGRMGSIQKVHIAGVNVWLCLATDLVPLQDERINTGTLYSQALPVVDDTALDPADATVVDYFLTGLSLSPYPPVDLRSDDGFNILWNTFAMGGAVNLKWSNRSREKRVSTAGNQLAGVPIDAAPGMDGNLTLRIWDNFISGNLKGTIVVTSGTSYTINNAALLAMFSGVEPSSFYVEYIQSDGSYPASRLSAQLYDPIASGIAGHPVFDPQIIGDLVKITRR